MTIFSCQQLHYYTPLPNSIEEQQITTEQISNWRICSRKCQSLIFQKQSFHFGTP